MLSSLTILYIIVFFILVACLYWYSTVPNNLPPGTTGLPFFGSMFSTWRASSSLRNLNHWKKMYGPLYKFYIADKLIVVLSDWDIIQEALVKQGNAYAGRPHVHAFAKDDLPRGIGLIGSEGELWKIQRRFAISTLRDFGFGRPILEPSIKEETDHLIRAMQAREGDPFDPATLLNNAVSNVINALIFGRRFEYDEEKFQELLRLIRSRLTEGDISALNPFLLSDKVASVMAYTPRVQHIFAQGRKLTQFIQKQIAEAADGFVPSRDEATNYIQAYYKARSDGRDDKWTFTDKQLIASVLNLFVAGTDTTATTLRWAIFYLAHNPEWQEKIAKEIQTTFANSSVISYADRSKLPLVEATIMETQRLGNLVPLGGLRRTMEATKLLGYDIPKDTIVVPLLTSVLRDPQVYPDPDKFDPNRFLEAQKDGEKSAAFTHLTPFSTGKRICLGESLARMELFLFFVALISNFKFTFSPKDPVPSEDGEQLSILRAPPRYQICAHRRCD